MTSPTKEKKPGFLKRFFSSKSSSNPDDEDVNGEGQGQHASSNSSSKHQGHHSDKQVPAYHHSTNLYEKAQADKLRLSPQPPPKNQNSPTEGSHSQKGGSSNKSSPPSPVDITIATDIRGTSPKPAAQTVPSHNHGNNEQPSPSTPTKPDVCFDADSETTETVSKSTKTTTKSAAAKSDLNQKSTEQQSQSKSKSKDANTNSKRNNNGNTKHLTTKSSSSNSKHGRKPSRKREQKKTNISLSIDTSKPLEYPCTPEHIMAYHKHKPFLTRMEESLIIELNEYECLVDSREIIGIIAKQTKLFELEPQDFWEEFFAYVDDIPSYDEVINFDIWQEFRDAKYPY
jgi:hypothetical protein